MSSMRSLEMQRKRTIDGHEVTGGVGFPIPNIEVDTDVILLCFLRNL